MRRHVRCTAGIVAAAVAGAAEAQQTADKSLTLTTYNRNLALVEHVRPIDVPAGGHRIEFPGVSAEIMAQAVSFSGAGLTLIEQNFDYDLLTPQELMEKAVGSRVRIVARLPAPARRWRKPRTCCRRSAAWCSGSATASRCCARTGSPRA